MRAAIDGKNSGTTRLPGACRDATRICRDARPKPQLAHTCYSARTTGKKIPYGLAICVGLAVDVAVRVGVAVDVAVGVGVDGSVMDDQGA